MSQQSKGPVGQGQLDITHQQIQAAIAKVVWKNENLRSEFVKNPKETIENKLGIKFAEDIHVKCIDATDPNTVYYVLLHHPSKAMGVEFSDEQLNAVAGGMTVGLYGNGLPFPTDTGGGTPLTVGGQTFHLLE